MRHSKEPVSIFFSRLGVLLVCATAAASFCAWVASYIVFAEIGIARAGHPSHLVDLWDYRWEAAVELGPGCLIIQVHKDPQVPVPLTFRGVFDLTMRLPEDHEYWRLKARGVDGGRFGEVLWSLAPTQLFRGARPVFDSDTSVPFWLILALESAMIWVLARGQRRRQRAEHGLCVKCGYDLRASKERCPECGTPIPLDKTRDRPPGKDLKPPPTDPPAEPLGPG
jgi:hypothetical protein